MNIVTFFILAIVSVILLLILKQSKSNVIIPASIVLSIILFKYAFSQLNESFATIKSIVNNTSLDKYTTTLFKVFGVSFLAEITADICRDSGENTIASRVEFAGKAELILISIPLVEEILKMAEQLIL